jgi:hypothetical protein
MSWRVHIGDGGRESRALGREKPRPSAVTHNKNSTVAPPSAQLKQNNRPGWPRAATRTHSSSKTNSSVRIGGSRIKTLAHLLEKDFGPLFLLKRRIARETQLLITFDVDLILRNVWNGFNVRATIVGQQKHSSKSDFTI